MSLTLLALIGIGIGVGMVMLAIVLEHKLHPRRRQKQVWRHKTT